MKVGEVAITTLKRVSPLDSVASFEDRLLADKVVVVEDAGQYRGLLTLTDVVERSHVLAVDCLSSRLPLGCDDSIESALEVMESSSVHFLPVMRGDQFQGVVSYKAIVAGQERERRKMAAHAARLEHHEALRQLASGVAHDFNNLTQIIMSLLERARSISGVPAATVSSVEQAEAALDRTHHLVAQLGAFARHGRVSRVSVSLESLIREHASFLARTQRVEVMFDFAADLRECSIERDRMAQVITNLVINAIQACAPAGGRLELSGRNVDVTAIDDLPLPAGPYVALTFRDNGVGIENANLGHIFDPYFTTKAEGTGLGLPLVAAIVADHGGHITVSSAPGEGTTFTVYLPANHV